MTVVLISGGLAFIIGLLLVRPFSADGRRLRARAVTADDNRQRELLRQLRDLDDDLAAGKLTEADHARLRDPVEREAAEALHREAKVPAGTAAEPAGKAAAATAAGVRLRPGAARSSGPVGSPGPAGFSRPAGSPGPAGRSGPVRWPRGWRGRAVTLLALAGAAAGVTVLLLTEVSARHPGQTITGNSVPGAAPAASGQAQAASGRAPAAGAGAKKPTAQQLAAVAAAEAGVKQHPKSVAAHLTLAGAYSAAGASQLAAVEYLAVTRLDPGNAAANTNLALLAFQVGRAAQGKSMVDRVLAASPRYPEALYVRGLINLVGLRQPRAAERDFKAYLTVAPFGSHRNAVVTLLALAQTQGRK